ncbi:lysine-specific demethylase JMJ706-like [Cucurbita moschata]|uniref:Lysine-specific demethylase JMJ706-like n=1 Tax=Cucurbita moschata TaxID=3662 RepID=A0A6J1FYZ8_CUCMO|nr:lysine-specific demethylase JMJ706-like [Cucurbita moschata]
MDAANSNPQTKRRRIKMPQPDDSRRPRMLYGINVNDHNWTNKLSECPVFRPSRQDFEDPFAYLNKISPKASNYGICKIVCPLNDIVPASLVLKREVQNFKFQPSVQPLKYATWTTMEDKISYYKRGRQYKYEEFENMANQVFVENYSSLACLSCKMFEREFWQEMAWGIHDSVEYGVDVEGSAFSKSDELGQSKWNLKKLPRLSESILRHLEEEIPGITHPMLYIGMVCSTFAWHVEDHYLYSINYLHSGAPKTWYAVPGSQANDFEKVAYDEVYLDDVLPSYDVDGAAQVLAEKTTMLPPSLFMKHDVSVFKAVQMPGEFVITFPRAYHAGFSHGFNCAEAVNFAAGEWFPYGLIAAKRYSFLERRPLIPFEELLCKEAIHICQEMMASPGDFVACTSHYAIMASCITHVAYYRASRRKLEKRVSGFNQCTSSIGTVQCGFCTRDRYLAFLMCHRCNTYPTCIFHGISTNCTVCGITRSLFLSEAIRYVEAAADYFENRKSMLSSYLIETMKIREEIQGKTLVLVRYFVNVTGFSKVDL